MRQRKDGSHISISLTVSPIRNENGRIIGASKIARDITEQTRLAAENARSFAEGARSQSDEGRVPRRAVARAAHAVERDRRLRAAVCGAASCPARSPSAASKSLERNATWLTQIVEDVLDVSRIVSGKIRLDVQPVNLAAIVEDAVATVQPAANAKGVASRR